MPTNREIWEQAFAESSIRDTDFTTMSGIPLDAGLRPGATASSPGSFRTPVVRTRRCIDRSCGRCGCSLVSARPTTPTGGSRRSSSPVATGCRRRSTCRRCWGSIPIIRWRSARSVAVVWRSIRWPTWKTCTPGIDLEHDDDVDDDQFAGCGDHGDVCRPGRKGRGQPRSTRWHVAERHLEGVSGAEGVRVPAAPVDAVGARHDQVHRGGDAAVAFDFDLRLSHPRGRLDGGRGVGVHTRQRVRLRRTGDAGRVAGGFVRATVVVLLQRPHRLLRRDRQVPRRSPDLGTLAARALRRQARTLVAAAVPHPDRRRVADRAAARGQHRAHGDRGVGRGARWHAVAAHQLDGRSNGAADREDGTHRACARNR